MKVTRAIAARLRPALLGPALATLPRRLQAQQQENRQIRVALGTLMAHEIAGSASCCEEAQFTSFSQFGEDGIIEYLIQRCDISPSTFVEIGVGTYAEANTRFLAEHRLWRGLIIDENRRLTQDLAVTQLDWKSQIQATSAFVTCDNVRHLVDPFVASEGLGLLSVDIDGVDYWVLERLVDIAPAMIIVEYNSLFGADAPVTIPYNAEFVRDRAEYHNVYYGAGLAAFDHLLAARGYALVGCTSAGNNAFFVRMDRLRAVPARTVRDAYRPRRFVEHRALDGSLTGIADTRRQLEDVRELPLVNVRDGYALSVADLVSD
jgi:hypothetical protein